MLHRLARQTAQSVRHQTSSSFDRHTPAAASSAIAATAVSSSARSSSSSSVHSHSLFSRAYVQPAAYLTQWHSSTITRAFHSTRRLQTDEDAERAEKLRLHRENMRLAREKAKAAAENPQPTTEETPNAEADKSSAASTATPTPDVTATPTPDSGDISNAPTQSVVSAIWKRIRDDLKHTSIQKEKEHFLAYWAKKNRKSEKAVKPRPQIQKSTIPMREWSEDPMIKIQKEMQEKKDKERPGDEQDGGTEIKVDEPAAPYEGETAVKLFDPPTHWENRIDMWREALRTLGKSTTVKIQNNIINPNEKLKEATDSLKEHVEIVKEQWETSQDPQVLKLRERVDWVVGESETGVAMGELMEGDPTFNYLDFMRDMEEVMIPEITRAFRLGDMKLLKSVMEGQACSTMFQSFKQRENEKVEWDDRILDINGLEVVKASLHEDEPYIHLTFVCQHVGVEYDVDPKNQTEDGKRVIKDPSKRSIIQNVYYSWAVKRDHDSPYYDWKIFEFQYQNIQQLQV